jgi:hypothetical protein
MRAFPSDSSFQIKTAFSKDEVLEILKMNVADSNPLNPIPPDTLFRGGVYHSDFEAKEVVGYTYALLPVFRGKIEKVAGGVTLRVRVSNVLTTFGVLWLWACAVGLCFVGVSVRRDFSTGIPLMFFGIFCAGIALFVTAFYFRKVEDGKKLLYSLFAGKENERDDNISTSADKES